MGRKPNAVISKHFARGAKIGNKSNRYEHTCLHCRAKFVKGRPEVLQAHIAKCQSISQAEKNEALAEFLTPTSDLSGTLPVNHVYGPANVPQDLDGLRALAEASDQVNAQHGLDPSLSDETAIISSGPSITQGPLYSYHTLPAPNSFGHNVGSYTVPDSITYNGFEYPDPNSLPTSFGQFNASLAAFSNAYALPQLGSAQFSAPPFHSSDDPVQAPTSDQDDHECMTDDSANSIDVGTTQRHFTLFNSAVASVSRGDSAQFVTELGHQADGRTRHTKEGDSQSRKLKNKLTDAQKQQTKEVREKGSCIRCGRLNKPCNAEKPCEKCHNIKSQDTWQGECTTLSKGQDFDAWYKERMTAEVQVLVDSATDGAVESGWTGRAQFSLFDQEEDTKLHFEIFRVEQDDVRDGRPQLLYLLVPGQNLQTEMLKYVRTNLEQILDTIQPHILHHSLAEAYALTQPVSATEKHAQTSNEMSRKGDVNLGRILEIWVASYAMNALSLGQSPSQLVVLGDEIPGDRIDTNTPEFRIIRYELLAAMEHIVKQSETDRVLHRLDSRIRTQQERALYNLYLAIFITLSAIERYCLFIRVHTGHLPDDMSRKAELLRTKYDYAVKNIRMLPRLKPDTETGLLVAKDLEDGRGEGRAPTSTSSKSKRPTQKVLDHSIGAEYIRSLAVTREALEARRVSRGVDGMQQVDGGDGGGSNDSIRDDTLWDGWLWSELLLSLITT